MDVEEKSRNSSPVDPTMIEEGVGERTSTETWGVRDVPGKNFSRGQVLTSTQNHNLPERESLVRDE